jgi:hypothetical protein
MPILWMQVGTHHHQEIVLVGKTSGVQPKKISSAFFTTWIWLKTTQGIVILITIDDKFESALTFQQGDV